MQVPESHPIPPVCLCCLQINFQTVDPFQVLHLCSELGLPLLQSYTLHHIASSLTSESVSRVLLTSESLLESCEDDMLKVALQRVHLDCISFIQTHTRTVFLSDSFLLLPKDTLITIISDNKVRRYTETSCKKAEHDHFHGEGGGREGMKEEGRKKMKKREKERALYVGIWVRGSHPLLAC